MTTLAGNSSVGWQDGVGSHAVFDYPGGIAVVPSSGAVIVSEWGGNRIRHITLEGVVTTLTGLCEGPSNPGWADGTGTSARFSVPLHMTILPGSAVLLVAELGNNRIRIVSLIDGTDRDAQVTTLAGSLPSFADGTGEAALFNRLTALAFDPTTGTVIVATASTIASAVSRRRRVPVTRPGTTWLSPTRPTTPSPLYRPSLTAPCGFLALLRLRCRRP